MARMTTARKLLLGLLGGGATFNPNFPLTISGLTLWLDASDASTLFQNDNGTTPAVADTNPVGYWGDKSGAGRNAIQATAGSRPTLKLAIQAGRPVVRGDGSDDSLVAPLAASATRTLFIVASKRTLEDGTTRSLGGYASTGHLYARSSDGAGWLWFSPATVAGGTVTNWVVIEAVFASVSAAVISLSGAAETAFDPNDSYATSIALTLFSRPGPASAGDYDVAEVIDYAAALTAGNRSLVRAYLGAKWGITVSP
jgi:hypothetical protein